MRRSRLFGVASPDHCSYLAVRIFPLSLLNIYIFKIYRYLKHESLFKKLMQLSVVAEVVFYKLSVSFV